MKTRIDFVSNSSSCSFVVAIGSNYQLDDFTDQLCKNCLVHADDDDRTWLVKQNTFNRAVLNYHLRVSELLYLGSLNTGASKQTYLKSDDPEWFDSVKHDIAAKMLSSDERIVTNDENVIVIEYDEHIDGMAVPTHKVDWITSAYHWNDDWNTGTPEMANAAKNIYEFAKNYADSKFDYISRVDSHTCFISRKTIWNTRALIAAGYDIALEKWMDLDKLENMLKNQDSLFCIHVNNGGDGVDDDALYTFGSWDGEDVFDGMPGAEVIYSETM